ncbi:hypothetical protein [Deinococcus yavapaiensis]|uniref:hypothetical protein n=1 Tax=Deinococcus yavapaiensis TaxID=309889 RepID=UPI0011B7D3B2|nr:hypothetical protein [Deinococcus yavapaiensis]
MEETYRAYPQEMTWSQGRERLRGCLAVRRFLNHSAGNVREVIRAVRRHALDQYEAYRHIARRKNRSARPDCRPDSLGKEGPFEALKTWMYRFNGTAGVHLVILSLCCGELRVPWSFLVWRGNGYLFLARLAPLEMRSRLPAVLHCARAFRHVLADAGVSSKVFIEGVVKLG